MLVTLRCGAQVESDNVSPDAAEFQCSKGCVHQRGELAAASPSRVPRFRMPLTLRLLRPFAIPAGAALAVVGFLGNEVGRTGPTLDFLVMEWTLADLMMVAGVLLLLWGGFFKHIHDEE